MAIEPHPGQKIVYQADHDGLYIGETLADPDPQNYGQWLIPAGCVETKPPETSGNKRYQWAEYKWKAIIE